MNEQLNAFVARAYWECRFRFFLMPVGLRVILGGVVATLIALALYIIGLRSEVDGVEASLSALYRTQETQVAFAANPNTRRAQLEAFSVFLPASHVVPEVTSSLHTLAREAQVQIKALSSQSVRLLPDAMFGEYAINLQLEGQQSNIERFLLLALDKHSSLALSRWSFQNTSADQARSNLDLILMVKP